MRDTTPVRIVLETDLLETIRRFAVEEGARDKPTAAIRHALVLYAKQKQAEEEQRYDQKFRRRAVAELARKANRIIKGVFHRWEQEHGIRHPTLKTGIGELMFARLENERTPVADEALRNAIAQLDRMFEDAVEDGLVAETSTADIAARQKMAKLANQSK